MVWVSPQSFYQIPGISARNLSNFRRRTPIEASVVRFRERVSRKCHIAAVVKGGGIGFNGGMDHLFDSLSTIQLLCLVAALGLALAFEFVNGFHDTANAVATVIYTHSLPPWAAVIWSGVWNLIGVLTSTGAVAFGVISLLPVELVMNVGSAAGFAMVFSLLISAIIWNLGTWYLGLPASSTHTLVGSIMGVGVMNSLINTGSALGGVNWVQAKSVLVPLLVSPAVGFVCTALLFWLLKLLVRK